MGRIEDIEARMRAVDSLLANAVVGLRQDVTTLKAVIEGLRAQAADEATLASMESLMSSMESRAAAFAVLDQETPAPETPE